MKTQILTWITLTAISNLSWAGPSSSGGGMAVVCRDDSGQIQSAELLDVYEAKQNPNATLLSSTGDFQKDFNLISKNVYRLQGSDYYDEVEFERYVKNFLSLVRWKHLPEKLPFLNDHGTTSSLPVGCNLEQLAIFFDANNSIAIQSEIWSMLDSFSKAALIQHEAFYKYERELGESTSESSRAYVREMISASGYTPVRSGVESAELSCYGESVGEDKYSQRTTLFYVKNVSNSTGTNDVEFQLSTILGRALIVKGTVTIPNFIFETRSVIDEAGRPYLVPNNSDQKSLDLKIETEHRSDWGIRFRYEANKPILLTLLQNGKVMGQSYLTLCMSFK